MISSSSTSSVLSFLENENKTAFSMLPFSSIEYGLQSNDSGSFDVFSGYDKIYKIRCLTQSTLEIDDTYELHDHNSMLKRLEKKKRFKIVLENQPDLTSLKELESIFNQISKSWALDCTLPQICDQNLREHTIKVLTNLPSLKKIRILNVENSEIPLLIVSMLKHPMMQEIILRTSSTQIEIYKTRDWIGYSQTALGANRGHSEGVEPDCASILKTLMAFGKLKSVYLSGLKALPPQTIIDLLNIDASNQVPSLRYLELTNIVTSEFLKSITPALLFSKIKKLELSGTKQALTETDSRDFMNALAASNNTTLKKIRGIHYSASTSTELSTSNRIARASNLNLRLR